MSKETEKNIEKLKSWITSSIIKVCQEVYGENKRWWGSDFVFDTYILHVNNFTQIYCTLTSI